MKNVYLHLNSRDEFLRIDISKIVYFEADGNYTNIVLANKLKGVVCMNLAAMKDPRKVFHAPYRGYRRTDTEPLQVSLQGIVQKECDLLPDVHQCEHQDRHLG